MLETLDGYSCIELLCQPDNLPSELPAPRAGIVSLAPAELLELLPGFAPAASVSMGLEPRPSSLELRLRPRQVLPDVELFQNHAVSAEDGHGNAASVDVHSEHIRAFSLQWIVLSQDGEELEIVLHYHGADFPASSKVDLEPSPSPILGDWQTYSLGVGADTQGRVPALSGLEVEETAVKSHDYAINFIGGLANPPSITSSPLYKLGSDAKSLTMFAVGQTMQFCATFDFAPPDQPEAFLSHLAEGAVGFLEFHPFIFSQLESVQVNAFLHDYQIQICYFYSSEFVGEGAPKVIYKPYKEPLNAARLPQRANFQALFFQFFIRHRKYSPIPPPAKARGPPR